MNTAKIKLLVGGLLIAGGIGYLGFLAADANAQFALDVKQYLDAPDKFGHRGLRLAGQCVKGTWKEEQGNHQFVVQDLIDHDRTVPVRFDGTIPDTFKDDSNVIVEGRMGEDGTFVATNVMAQCPSKYEAMTEAEMQALKDGREAKATKESR